MPASKNWGSEIEEISPDNLLSFFGPDSSLSQNHLIQFAWEPCIDHFVDFVWKGGEACSLSFSIDEEKGVLFKNKKNTIPGLFQRIPLGNTLSRGVWAASYCVIFFWQTLCLKKGGGGF